MNSGEQRVPRTTEAEIRVSEMARREADRQARRIRWERLLEARRQYVEWNAFSLWARAIAEAEGEIPAWLAKVLEVRGPGFLGVERSRRQAGPEEKPLLWRRLLEWIEDNVVRDANDEGWLRAVTFYAVRDPVYAQDSAYWQHCEREWKRQRPSSYPSFEEWRRASEQCSDEVLDAFGMREEKRQIIKASRAVGPERLAETLARYMDWEAFTYRPRSLLEADIDLPDAASQELERRCPGFLECDQELRSTLSPEDYTRRWLGGPREAGATAVQLPKHASSHNCNVRSGDMVLHLAMWLKTLEPLAGGRCSRDAPVGSP